MNKFKTPSVIKVALAIGALSACTIAAAKESTPKKQTSQIQKVSSDRLMGDMSAPKEVKQNTESEKEHKTPPPVRDFEHAVKNATGTQKAIWRMNYKRLENATFIKIPKTNTSPEINIESYALNNIFREQPDAYKNFHQGNTIITTPINENTNLYGEISSYPIRDYNKFVDGATQPMRLSIGAIDTRETSIGKVSSMLKLHGGYVANDDDKKYDQFFWQVYGEVGHEFKLAPHVKMENKIVGAYSSSSLTPTYKFYWGDNTPALDFGTTVRSADSGIGGSSTLRLNVGEIIDPNNDMMLKPLSVYGSVKGGYGYHNATHDGQYIVSAGGGASYQLNGTAFINLDMSTPVVHSGKVERRTPNINVYLDTKFHPKDAVNNVGKALDKLKQIVTWSGPDTSRPSRGFENSRN